jgi:hypothetical protein
LDVRHAIVLEEIQAPGKPSAVTFSEFRLAEEIRKLAVNSLPVRQPLAADNHPNRLIVAAAVRGSRS